jgi:hypothetical protein
MATKKTSKKTSKKAAPKKKAGKKVKAKKGGKFACRLCGRIETVNIEETIDGVYGYVDAADIICCGEEMATEK